MKLVLAIGAACALSACAGPATDNALPKLVMLSPDGTRNVDIAYSPDGAHLVYLAPAAGDVPGWQLWTAKADFTAPSPLPVTTIFTGNPPVWSPNGTRIAALSNKFGTANVVVVPAAGGEAKRVTLTPGVQIPLAWNKDNDRIAYYASVEGSFRGFSGSASSGKSVPLVGGVTLPHFGGWSPDGSHIAYFVVDGQRSTIWVADSAGNSPKQLTTEGFETFSFPFAPWSPDGKELLYESRRTGTSDMWVVPIDGGKPRQLTRDVRNDYSGFWSSDGKWIAFMSDRGRQVDVWVVPAAGGVEQRVTDTPAEEAYPRWRPGTHEIAFVTRSEKSAIWMQSLADGKEQQLTPDSLRTTWFNVSPDGKSINYVIERGGGIQDLAVTPLAGGPSRTLVAGGGTVTQPRWSPDGSKIVFTSDRGGTYDVWVVDAAGGAPRQLDNWPSSETSALWSADGSAVYFISDRNARLGDVWKVPVAGGEPTRVTNDGSLNGNMVGHTGAANLFLTTINGHGGQLAISMVGSDGKLKPIWDRTNAFPGSVSPSGDAISALVEQPNGTLENMILFANGAAPRKVLTPTQQAGAWAPDGKSMLCYFTKDGTTDLGILNLADGTTRRLTTTPENETGGEWTPDARTVVFVRRQTIDRIVTADLSKILK